MTSKSAAGTCCSTLKSGHAGVPHGRLHVHPGGVGPFGHRVGALVEDLVEDLQPLVGEPDLVGVGVEQHPGHLARAVLGVLGPLLTPDVAGRLGHAEEQPFHLWPEGLHCPPTLRDR